MVSYTKLIRLYLPYMEDVEMNNVIFIDEESYQQIKKKLGKEDDYFNEKEFENFDVILT